nr:phage protein GemA/Gp16 family protein [Aeromonas sp. 1805]
MARQGVIRDGSSCALNAWVQRMTARLNGGVGVAEVGWLDEPLAVKVLEALKRWQHRVGIASTS